MLQRTQRLAGIDLDAAHLAYGYALTVHRAQGATVDGPMPSRTAEAGSSPM